MATADAQGFLIMMNAHVYVSKHSVYIIHVYSLLACIPT